MTVLEFKRQPEQHAAGKAICVACTHTWTATIEKKDFDSNRGWLECPECHTMRGRFVWPFAPAPGTDVWTCKCGNDFFHITREGTVCPNCGNYQTFPKD